MTIYNQYAHQEVSDVLRVQAVLKTTVEFRFEIEYYFNMELCVGSCSVI